MLQPTNGGAVVRLAEAYLALQVAETHDERIRAFADVQFVTGVRAIPGPEVNAEKPVGFYAGSKAA